MDSGRSALFQATTIGTVVQLAMVIVGHFVAAVAALFGPLGMLISLAAGLLYAARAKTSGYGAAALGGAVAGGACALIGVVVSFALGDVTATILALGTLSSAVTGAIGGTIGRAVGAKRRVALG